MKIRTEDGISLDAELHVPEGATTCVVLAHPHPDYGGSMHVPVIDPGTDHFLGGAMTAVADAVRSRL